MKRFLAGFGSIAKHLTAVHFLSSKEDWSHWGASVFLDETGKVLKSSFYFRRDSTD